MIRPLRRLHVSRAKIGSAMLQATTEKLLTRIIENREIHDLSDRFDTVTRQR